MGKIQDNNETHRYDILRVVTKDINEQKKAHIYSLSTLFTV